MSQNKSVEEWNDDMQHAYDSILFNHNPIEADKPFGEMLERVLTKLVEKTRQTSQEREREIVDEYKQFVLNILDGVDIADQQMGNKGGGTLAIRHALNSRIINPNKDWRV